MKKKRPFEKNINAVLPAAIRAVEREIDRSQDTHGQFQSPHEAIAVIREEYLELEREIFHGSKNKAIIEAVQLAAMAVRFACEFNPECPCIKNDIAKHFSSDTGTPALQYGGG